MITTTLYLPQRYLARNRHILQLQAELQAFNAATEAVNFKAELAFFHLLQPEIGMECRAVRLGKLLPAGQPLLTLLLCHHAADLQLRCQIKCGSPCRQPLRLLLIKEALCHPAQQ
ncbi:hypothetical protein [Candidatus Erwinia dacicola]|uniref:Uncharacterized protein n=1 Tax=Candidatus Erwinia dacicola TaxID=252393 RepID=A0A1E7Z1Z5_9GAMM|nr:hypothetical protein [Candidatus Erwinia dacicola]NJD84782.1 hypothetical protein [Candidatus Erwinia dacicola]OFC62754.1 hypothetical protein BBW68_01475 [Candidatus Erwinia dacicola]